MRRTRKFGRRARDPARPLKVADPPWSSTITSPSAQTGEPLDPVHIFASQPAPGRLPEGWSQSAVPCPRLLDPRPPAAAGKTNSRELGSWHLPTPTWRGPSPRLRLREQRLTRGRTALQLENSGRIRLGALGGYGGEAASARATPVARALAGFAPTGKMPGRGPPPRCRGRGLAAGRSPSPASAPGSAAPRAASAPHYPGHLLSRLPLRN